MARLFSSGFEQNTTTASIEWTAILGTAPAIQGTTVHGAGTKALQVTSLASATRMGLRYQYAAANANGPIFARIYFRYATAPSADNRIIALENVTPSAIVTISLTSTGTLKLFLGGVQVGSASAVLSTGRWYMIEIKFDNTGGAGAGIVSAQIDGAVFASSTTQSPSSGIGTILVGGNLNAEAQTTGNWFFDDIAINDSTGSFQTSYPGQGQIISLRPNAAGDNNMWTTELGAGSSTNYTHVNEVTPDGDTAYIQSKNANDIDDYNIDDTPSGLGSNDIINVVHVGAYYRQVTGSPFSTFNLRTKASASGTVSSSANITANSATYTENANAVPKNYPLTLYQDPTSTNYTKATLDSSQIGINVVTGSTNNFRVSTVWMMVDFSPVTTQTQTGKTRIQQSVNQTQTGLARLQQVVNKTTTGLARVTAKTNQTITGLTRITAATLKTISGKAAIQNTTTQITTGIARMQQIVNKTITGVTRITTATLQTIAGKSRITAATLRTITGITRITASALKSITGMARITAATLQAITGKSRLRVAVNQAITGLSRMQKAAQAAITGLARITANSSQMITGRGRITAKIARDQTGRAFLNVPRNQDITGVAFVNQTTIQQTQGTADIRKVTAQYISGKANIVPVIAPVNDVTTLRIIRSPALLGLVEGATTPRINKSSTVLRQSNIVQ